MNQTVKKILVADDDQGMVTILSHVLRAEGYDMDVARDGLSALEKASAGNYNALVFDMNMPGMKGLDVLVKLRAAVPPVDTPAILLTGSDPDDFTPITAAMKRVQFMEKPFDLDRFLSAVKDCVSS